MFVREFESEEERFPQRLKLTQTLPGLAREGRRNQKLLPKQDESQRIQRDQLSCFNVYDLRN